MTDGGALQTDAVFDMLGLVKCRWPLCSSLPFHSSCLTACRSARVLGFGWEISYDKQALFTAFITWLLYALLYTLV